ncbi:MAG: zf-HC2 domain-containing protein [Blautia sp.]|nr:zf-HC2 domain-containing protein [Blautia sp.]
MRNECNIIRDILPLYVEKMVSKDTASFVEEHLEGCEKCREELEAAKAAGKIERACKGAGTQEEEAEPLKTLKKKMRRRKIRTVLLSFLAAVTFLGGTAFMLCVVGFASDSEDIRLEPEIRYDLRSYQNQHFMLHIYQMKDKPLCEFTRNVYLRDENGELIYDEYGHKILCGYEILVRESPLSNVNPNNYTLGYSYRGDTAPDEDFDFTITVIFKDTTVVYSMREMGLFEPREDLDSTEYWRNWD